MYVWEWFYVLMRTTDTLYYQRLHENWRSRLRLQLWPQWTTLNFVVRVAQVELQVRIRFQEHPGTSISMFVSLLVYFSLLWIHCMHHFLNDGALPKALLISQSPMSHLQADCYINESFILYTEYSIIQYFPILECSSVCILNSACLGKYFKILKVDKIRGTLRNFKGFD